MKKNMGTTDKVIRVLIALSIGVLYFLQVISGTLAIILLVLAGVFILTSLISFCPLYAVLGVRTTGKKE